MNNLPQLEADGPKTVTSSLKVSKYQPLPAITSSRGAAVPARDDLNDTLAAIVPPKTSNLFIAVKSISFGSQEFKDRFSGFGVFYEQLSEAELDMRNNDGLEDIIKDISISILGHIFQEESIAQLATQIFNEPCPYYAYISSKPRGISLVTEHEDTDTADIDSDSDFNALISNPEFQSSVEGVLEETIYNLMQEVNLEEFEWYKYPILVKMK